MPRQRSPEEWRSFWSMKTRPLHLQDTKEFYERLSLELRSAIGPLGTDDRVLELGCGGGHLHEYLGFDGVAYRGVDMSSSMLEKFSESYPGTELVEADAISYAEGGPYDLIFSLGLIQYFSRQDLRHHLLHVRSSLAPGARVIHAGVPWRFHRRLYRWGWAWGWRPVDLWSPRRLLRPLFGFVRRVVAPRRQTMGHWWSLHEIDRIARKCGYLARFHGSVQYVYRFHITFTPQDSPVVVLPPREEKTEDA